MVAVNDRLSSFRIINEDTTSTTSSEFAIHETQRTADFGLVYIQKLLLPHETDLSEDLPIALSSVLGDFNLLVYKLRLPMLSNQKPRCWNRFQAY